VEAIIPDMAGCARQGHAGRLPKKGVAPESVFQTVTGDYPDTAAR
jgi:hypothetical protein